MSKPIGPICNLDCRYCFYLEKEALYKNDGKWRMSAPLLESYIRQYIEAQPGAHVSFAWQGGEPTLLGLGFFQDVVRWQKKYANGKTIDNALQTNGTLLDRDWASFLRENDFLVGVSIDGPQELHDRYRVGKKGESTFDRVMAGIHVLQESEVAFNTLTCVNRAVSSKPLEVYRFLKSIGSSFMQFIPIVERKPGVQAATLGLDLATPGDGIEEEDLPVTPWSVRPQDFGNFYRSIFDRWLLKDVGSVFVQLFEVTLAKWVGAGGGLCVHEETCGRALAVEHNGDLYSCDHFVYPDFKLGNLLHDGLEALVDSEAQRAFGQAKKDSLPPYCKECEVRAFCNGGCPKERFLKTPQGDPGLNYLCQGYRAFFNHVAPAMAALTELHRRRIPSERIMDLAKRKAIPGYRPFK